MNECLSTYFRCPPEYSRFAASDALPENHGYFRFGDAVCFGNYAGPRSTSMEDLPNLLDQVELNGEGAHLPFNPDEIARNLHIESYAEHWEEKSSLLSNIYYFFRPALPVAIRKYLQRIHLRDWDKRTFPQWPVDCSVDNMTEQLMLLALKACGVERIPFIWFWPEGHQSCAIMTHDVETAVGRDFCSALMDIDDAYGIKSSFQVVPEERYGVSPEFLQSIRDRGFEIVVHDLNHDGRLYQDRAQFLERVAKINSYGREFGAKGFRAAVLYRNPRWQNELQFSFDMSIPNVAHLDPQRGGCCTVMPYFIGNILEIPVTTVQDYTLFNILNDYSINLWKQQIDIIMNKNGCMSFIIHPDYIEKPHEVDVYKQLLEYLNEKKSGKAIWFTLPREVDRWWRERMKMRLVKNGDNWQIEGDGKERARVAYASESNGRLVFSIDN